MEEGPPSPPPPKKKETKNQKQKQKQNKKRTLKKFLRFDVQMYDLSPINFQNINYKLIWSQQSTCFTRSYRCLLLCLLCPSTNQAYSFHWRNAFTHSNSDRIFLQTRLENNPSNSSYIFLLNVNFENLIIRFYVLNMHIKFCLN